MRRLRGLVANLLLAAVSAALVLVAVEGAARVARHFQKGGKEQRTRLQYTEYDPLLGWKHQPGARARYERREYTTEVVYYDFDSHWNRLGHPVAAREVEAFLRRQGWACAA
jgi:hypothetical protein